MSKLLKLCSLLSLLTLLSVALGSRADAGEPGWELISKSDGVHVWMRDTPGGVPSFRGQAYIKADIDAILREMLDWRHHTEWMFGCVESALLKEFTPLHAIMYSRLDAPWPVWDRDVIAETKVERSADGRQLTVHFKNVDSKLRAVPPKVVRVPKLVGFYKLWQFEPQKTKVLYEVESDVGGSVPRWLALYGAKALPYETLSRLRERVEEARKRDAKGATESHATR